MDFRNIGKNFVKSASEHSPEILTGLTAAGITALTFLCLKPKACAIMEKHREKMKDVDIVTDDEEYKIKKKKVIGETVKEMAISMGPTIILSGATIACAVLSNKASARKIVALSTLYEIASKSASDLEDAIKEVVPKKAQEIKETAIANRVKETPYPEELAVAAQTLGVSACRDPYLAYDFISTRNDIERAVNKLSSVCQQEMYVTLYDLYFELSMKDIPPAANDIKWTTDDLIEGNLPIMVTTSWDKTETVPIISLSYEVPEGARFRRR